MLGYYLTDEGLHYCWLQRLFGDSALCIKNYKSISKGMKAALYCRKIGCKPTGLPKNKLVNSVAQK